LIGVTKWRGILTLGWQFVVDCRKMGDKLRKSGKLRILKIPIGKDGRNQENPAGIGKVGRYAGISSMHC
jgi:hypothetical protein